jgi:hypothetical protein
MTANKSVTVSFNRFRYPIPTELEVVERDDLTDERVLQFRDGRQLDCNPGKWVSCAVVDWK